MCQEKETYFEVGDTVYSQSFGKGIVKDVSKSNYPIFVEFELNISACYTNEGKLWNDENISLSQNPLPPIVNTPKRKKVLLTAYEAVQALEEGKKVKHVAFEQCIIKKNNHYYDEVNNEFANLKLNGSNVKCYELIQKIQEDEYNLSFQEAIELMINDKNVVCRCQANILDYHFKYTIMGVGNDGHHATFHNYLVTSKWKQVK